MLERNVSFARVDALRRKLGMTQTEFMFGLGMRKGTYNNWKDQGVVPRVDFLAAQRLLPKTTELKYRNRQWRQFHHFHFEQIPVGRAITYSHCRVKQVSRAAIHWAKSRKAKFRCYAVGKTHVFCKRVK